MPPSAEELDAKLRPWWAVWYARLPQPQRDALAEYKSDRYLNYVIAGEPGRQFTPAQLARFRDLDDAFAHAPVLSTPQQAWRGMTCYVDPHGVQTWSPPEPGTVQGFRAWTSVSMLERPAATEAYAAVTNRLPNDYSVLMLLNLPAGQRVIYAEIAKPQPTHEAELLLPRLTRYRVTSFEPLRRFATIPELTPGPRAFLLCGDVI